MKYAIVDTEKARIAGIKEEYHLLSDDKRYIVVNENELKKMGDPVREARKLGGELVDLRTLKTTLNSTTWNK